MRNKEWNGMRNGIWNILSSTQKVLVICSRPLIDMLIKISLSTGSVIDVIIQDQDMPIFLITVNQNGRLVLV